jgi:hypothetical protein
MNLIRRAAVVALALASAACATDWIKPGASEQELLADKGSCEREAENEYASGGLQGVSTFVDRRGYFDRCMIARGWRDKAAETAIVQDTPPAAETELPLRFPVYSR